MMPQRRQMIAPQGLDIQPMQPMAPMQFPVAQQEQTGGGMDSLMQLAQQFRAGQEAKKVQQANTVHQAETDAPMQRRKPPFADIAGIAQAYA